MRTKLGWALSVLGVLVAVLGIAVMVVLGPDSRFTTGPHAIETDDIAVVTAPKVITWAGVQVDLLAEVPVRKPIFVGIANSVDVASFVGRTKRLEVTSYEKPWKIRTREVDGQPNLPGAPTAVDWWIDSSAGLGGASISTELPDETVSVAILSVGSSNLTGLQVTVAYGVKGGFAKGAGLLLLGAGAVVVGLLIRRGRDDDWDDDDWEDEDDLDGPASVMTHEDVVYVVVDEDGVEREITAEEAAEFDVVEEVFEVVEEVPAEKPAVVVEPEPEPEVSSSPPKIPGVFTAGDIAAELEPAPAPEPEPEPEPEAEAPVEAEPEPSAEKVMYVYVDEDGVEHEVSEDELAEFEIVDEEDET